MPRIIFEGESSLEEFIEYLNGEKVRKIFIVSDRVIAELDMLKILTDSLKDFEVSVYTDIEPEPTISTVESLALEVAKYKPEVIVALGGGSVIDAAKGAWIKYENPEFDLQSISPFEKIGVGEKAILASIPTTSGTGSEATLAVVYSILKDGRKEKIALGSYELVSNIIVLDPRFVVKLPRKLTIYTALDALSHATEAYVSTAANDFTDALSYKVILNVFDILPKLVENLNDIYLRRRMHFTATMGGIAFSNSGLGLAHGIAHTVGPAFTFHHGRTVSIVLPYVVKFNSLEDEVYRKYDLLSRELYKKGFADDEPFYLQLYNFIYKISGEVCFKGLIEEKKYFDSIDELSGLILQDPDVVYNPIVPGEEDVKKILRDSFNCIIK